MTAALAIASGTIGAVPVRVGVPVRLWTALGALAIALALLVVPTPRPALGIVVAPHDYPGGGMIGFGSVDLDPPDMPEPVNSPVFAGVASPDGQGYLLASADGGVFAFGDATYEGSLGNLALNGPVVAMAATPTGKGYWLGAIDGGIFAFGDAKFYGSVPGVLKPGQSLNQPIVGMAATPDGMGYWLVAADGGIFSFGDARFYGSTGGIKLDQPIVGMAATPDGKGYWLVAADGGIFSFGDAKFHGSEANAQLPDPVVGMIASPDGGGYTMVTANGVVFALGDAKYYGQLQLDPTATPISAIVGNGKGNGYWLLDPDAWTYSFTSNSHEGSFPGSSTIVSSVASQVQPDPDTGYYCNPYGPCEEWCALFATWAWQRGGVPIPSYGFTGDMYDWAAQHGRVLAPTATPDPGDAVLYGTGPDSVYTSVHVAVVAQVWPDGALITVDGDSGPGKDGYLSVIINGPFLPADSPIYNGVPIYAYAQP
jgi:hypothetical protein